MRCCYVCLTRSLDMHIRKRESTLHFSYLRILLATPLTYEEGLMRSSFDLFVLSIASASASSIRLTAFSSGAPLRHWQSEERHIMILPPVLLHLEMGRERKGCGWRSGADAKCQQMTSAVAATRSHRRCHACFPFLLILLLPCRESWGKG